MCWTIKKTKLNKKIWRPKKYNPNCKGRQTRADKKGETRLTRLNQTYLINQRFTFVE